MIPEFVIVPGALWPLLPPGIHDASWSDIYQRYGLTPWRIELLDGLKNGLDHLFTLGCPQVFLDGSFVTAKPKPNDYEVVWDPRFVDPYKIDPVFLDFSTGTKSQKAKYMGEYFPSTYVEANSGRPFIEFFQTDTDSGQRKGIIRVLNFLSKGGAI
ncbi:MAG TPA: hypothetical protein VG870_03910 [Chitinophagaceae bacterium]|nr:hypothetical protein [Chitinophagaceae bacterium]